MCVYQETNTYYCVTPDFSIFNEVLKGFLFYVILEISCLFPFIYLVLGAAQGEWDAVTLSF